MSQKANALAEYLDCEREDIEEEKHDRYGLTVFSMGKEKYAVGTDAQADKAVKMMVRNKLWVLPAGVFLNFCDLPIELEEVLTYYQEQKKLEANIALIAIIEECGDFDDFVDDVISEYSRGYFLSSRGSAENEVDYKGKTYYIYQMR